MDEQPTERELAETERARAIVAELWTPELVRCLAAALEGRARWRSEARALLQHIQALHPPERPAHHERLREIDHQKRVAEIQRDIANPFTWFGDEADG